MPNDPTDRLIEHVRIRFGLRPRATKLLRAILRRGDDPWWCAASRAELAAAAELSTATVRRALADLRRLGILTTHQPAGRPPRHHVRSDVLFDDASLPHDLRQLALNAAAEPAHQAAGEPAHFGPSEPAHAHPAPPPDTTSPPEGLIDRLINPSGPAQAGNLPALPRRCWLDAEDDLPDVLERWLARCGLAAADLPGGRGLLGLLGAVLAAREAEPRNLQAYVVACLRRGVADGFLARADRLLRGTPAHGRSPPAWTPHGVPRDDLRYSPRR